MIRVLTIFIGSFLAFGVQPLVGKTLLPAFGGMASVWVTCLTAFQFLLLVGYFYAHRLGHDGAISRRSLSVHVGLLFCAAVWLAAVAFLNEFLAHWAASFPVPALGAIAAVLVLVAIPYVLLSANASVVQTIAGGNYRLYAVSNLGSFAGLFAYPFVAEPFLSIQAQWIALSVGTAVYAVALLLMRNGGAIPEGSISPVREAASVESNPAYPAYYWLLIPAVSCFLLNAATAYLTSNVSPIPLVWAIVLGIYLLSYVIGFAKWGELLLPLWIVLSIASGFTCIYGISVGASSTERFLWNFPAILSFLLFACTALHTALCRARPAGKKLTRFNLCLAAGGAVGGAVSGLAMPLLASDIIEYPVALVVTLGVLLSLTKPAAVAKVCDEIFSFKLTDEWIRRIGIAVLVVSAIATHRSWQAANTGVVMHGRSFYGAWHVKEDVGRTADGHNYPVYIFSHGGTAHGLQSKEEAFRNEGTAYYGPHGAGLAFDFARDMSGSQDKALRCGIIGLGIGTMAHWGQPGDFLRFYEICPLVTDLAENGTYFNFVKNCKSQYETVVGDARQALEVEERENAPKYDMFAVDAYSGDSIPLHLMTAEAFDLYRSRLKDDGLLALHITNWHIDLLPVAKAAAKRLGWTCTIIPSSGGRFTFPAVWAFISKKPVSIPNDMNWIDLNSVDDKPLPTDAKGSILAYLKFKSLFSLKED